MIPLAVEAQTASQAGVLGNLTLPGLLGVVAIFLVINGFFVAMEFAVVALRKTRVDEMIRDGVRGAQAVRRAKDHLDDFVAAAQLGITVASLVIGAAEPALEALLHPHLERLGLGSLSHPLAFSISLAAITTLHVVLGEQVPKMLAIHSPGKVALTTAPLTEIFQRVCRPAIWILSRLTSVVLKLLGIHSAGGSHHGQVYSEEEIQALLGLREAAGLAEAGESEMVARVFSFFDMVATQVMVPRTEMVCVKSEDSIRDLVGLAARERHERYPIFGENLDDIQGIVLLKDVVQAISQDPTGKVLDQKVSRLMREVLCLPGSLSVSGLMAQMRKNHTRVVVVLDEFGGTAGMVTYGDLLERIVGEEVEEVSTPGEPEDIQALGDGRYRVSGLVLIEDIEDAFDLDIDDEHNDTIAGMVFSLLGRKPTVGDEVVVQGLRFSVESMDGLRIDRLLVEPIVADGDPIEEPPMESLTTLAEP